MLPSTFSPAPMLNVRARVAVPKQKSAEHSRMTARAAPVRALLRDLVKRHLKARGDRQSLASFLGTSESYVRQMIYHGAGGLDAWISALMFCLELDAEKFALILEDLRVSSRRLQDANEADRLWFALDETMSGEDKLYWLHVIKAAHAIEQELAPRRRQARRKKESSQ